MNKESSVFAQLLAKMMCESLYQAMRAEEKRREQLLEFTRLECGKYDREKLEQTEYVADPLLTEWLDQLLIDAVLERKDKPLFLTLTQPLLEGW